MDAGWPDLLSLERYAEVAAELDVGAPRDRVLAEANVSLQNWLSTQQYWLQRIGAEALRGRQELLSRYNERFGAARRAALARRLKKRDVYASEDVAASQRQPQPESIPLPPAVQAVPSAQQLAAAQHLAAAQQVAAQQGSMPMSVMGSMPMSVAVPPPMPAAAPASSYGVQMGAAQPRLTLPQYASLCAEMAVRAGQEESVCARYGFDEPGYARERQSWEARFAEDRMLFQEYLARFRHYRDWMLGSATGPSSR